MATKLDKLNPGDRPTKEEHALLRTVGVCVLPGRRIAPSAITLARQRLQDPEKYGTDLHNGTLFEDP